MVTIELDSFSDPNFDVKTWINKSLESTEQRQPSSTNDAVAPTLEQETATLMTRLQLASEQASQQVGVITDQVIKSMPRILYEIKLITDDAQAARQGIHQVEKNLGGVELGTDGSFEKLRQLHFCKTRMEDCLSALMEAENWNNLESEVSKVINNHDYEGADTRLQDALSYLSTTHQSPSTSSSL